jgi:hypothetical protein
MEFNSLHKGAAASLSRHLEGNHWFSAVGITCEDGIYSLIVYTSKRLPPKTTLIPSEWRGLRVKSQNIGKIMPVLASGA